MIILYILVKSWKDSTNLGMIRLPSGAHISSFCGLRKSKGRNCVLLIFKSPNVNIVLTKSKLKKKTDELMIK